MDVGVVVVSDAEEPEEQPVGVECLILKPKILGTYLGAGLGGTSSGYCNSSIWGKLVPK